jgi:hypothetical protein
MALLEFEMKIEGREVIGKQTEVSARTLLSFSAVVIVIQVYRICGEEWDFLGRKFPAEVVDQLLPLLLIFLLIGHILHWYSDHSSFRNWFKISEAPLNGFDDMGKINGTEPLIVGLEKRLQSLNNAIELLNKKVIDSGSDYKKFLEQFGVVESSATEIVSVLRTLSGKHQKVVGPAFVLVYVWYGVVPVFASLFALGGVFDVIGKTCLYVARVP